AGLGYGTAPRWAVGADGPSTPCDASSDGRPFTTRQISNPSPGRPASKPFFLRFSSRRYSEPSGRTSTLKHSRGESSIGDSTSVGLTAVSITAGFAQPSFSFDQGQKCCGLPSLNGGDVAHQGASPVDPGFSGLPDL